MTIIEFLVLLLIAGIAGGVAQAIVGYSRGGCLASIGIGLVGAVLGMLLARALNAPELFTLEIGGRQFPLVWSIIGASLFAAVIGLLSRGRRW